MTMLLLQTAAELLPDARLILPPGADPAALRIARVHTDTRTLQAGDLFVALKGERFDAHDFLPQARAAGAVAVLASRQRGCRACRWPTPARRWAGWQRNGVRA